MPPATQPAFICARCAHSISQRTTALGSAHRALSTSTTRRQSEANERILNHDLSAPPPEQQPARWQQTPAAMRMPYRLRPLPNQPVWKVNDQQEPLDAVYDSLLARVEGNIRGRDMLDEETKWLAVTHKSFDHGRRGFNDRLAFLGKRIVDLQVSLALLQSPVINPNIPSSSATAAAPPTPTNAAALPSSTSSPSTISPQHQAPFTSPLTPHPALNGLENLTPFMKSSVITPVRLAQVAASHGLNRVVRWKPRKSDRLHSSGVDTVMSHTLYSIVGAVALKRGGDVAAKLAREKILLPLGLR